MSNRNSSNNNNNTKEQPMLETNANHQKHHRLTLLNYLNLAAYLLNIAVTYGIGAGLFWKDLPTNSELSRKYQTLITPVGWAFAIWGVIFVAQAVWAVVLPLVWPAFRPKQVTMVGYNYVAVCLMQIGWTIAFSTEVIWLSLVFMGLIGVFLWSIVLTPVNHQVPTSSTPNTGGTTKTSTTSASNNNSSSNNYNYWLEKFPFTIHAGWITAAFLVNASVLLVALGLSAQIQYHVALASLTVLLLVAIYTVIAAYNNQQMDRYRVIPLVLAWASWGIFQELSQTTDETILTNFTRQQIDMIQYGAAACSGVIVTLVVVQAAWTCWLNSRQRQQGTAEEAVYLRAKN